MTTFVPPVAPIGAATAMDALSPMMSVPGAAPTAAATPSFADMIASGVGQVETKLARADALANAFALDDSIPVHQVTFALEEARLSLELMLQVRGKVVEAYQQLMGMQL